MDIHESENHLSNIKELLSIAPAAILISGIAYKYFYFSYFGINVFNNFELSEYFFSFFSVLTITIVMLVTIFFFTLKNAKGGELKTTHLWLVSTVLFFAIFLGYSITTYYSYKAFLLSVTEFGKGLVIWFLISVLFMVTYWSAKHNGEGFTTNKYVLYATFYLYYLAICSAYGRVNAITIENNPSDHVSIHYIDGGTFSNTELLFIGENNQSFFFFNKKKNISVAFSKENADRIDRYQ